MSSRSRLVWVFGVCTTPLLLFVALPGAFSWWPLLFIALIPFFCFLGSGRGIKQSMQRGFLVGLVLHLFQLYWVVAVLRQFGHLSWYVALAALLLLASYMASYTSLFAGAFTLLLKRAPGILALFALPALWVGLDWLRSWAFSGFPWMDLGYGFWSQPQLMQTADILGHYGHTFFIVFFNLCCFFLLTERIRGQKALFLAGFVALFLMGTNFYSKNRWDEVSQLIHMSPSAAMGVVQGNVEQGQKWQPDRRQKTVDHYLDLSRKLLDEQTPEMIIWPETALPFYPRKDSLVSLLNDFVVKEHTALLTGAPWYHIIDWDKRQVDYFNSALLLDVSGKVAGRYYKSHLVPFGEYVPMQQYLPFLSPLVEAVGDFTPGQVGKPLKHGIIRAGILICYESIFPDISRQWVENGANVLVNLTNDAWYGKSSAPYQSWAMTIYRAVETRRSLVRSANTGISGMVDPLGRIMKQSPLFTSWKGASDMPLLTVRTVFVNGGYLFAPVCGLFGLLAVFWYGTRRKKTRLMM